MLQLFRTRRRTRTPVLFIAGAQKCGTTTLWNQLRKHPEFTPAEDPASGEVIKELSFFAGVKGQTEGLSTDEQRALFETYYPGGDKVRLDATPEYLPALHDHHLLSEAYPEAKVLVSLRNPVDRAYSQYNHYVQQMPATEHWDWQAPGESYSKNIDLELEAHDPEAPKVKGLVGRGHYAQQLRSLLSFFPREQVRVVIMERWSQDPRALHDELQRELGVRRRRLTTKVSHRRKKTSEPVDPATRARLEEHFQPYNEELEDLLGERIPEWTEAWASR